jgi:hypothetical protein
MIIRGELLRLIGFIAGLRKLGKVIDQGQQSGLIMPDQRLVNAHSE